VTTVWTKQGVGRKRRGFWNAMLPTFSDNSLHRTRNKRGSAVTCTKGKRFTRQCHVL